jgi:hypothetical protein
MTDAMYNQIESAARDRMVSYRRAVEPYDRAYRRTATARGLDPTNVLLDLGDPVEERSRRRTENPPEVPRDVRAIPTDQRAARIRERFPNDPEMRRRAAVAAGVDPRLVE